MPKNQFYIFNYFSVESLIPKKHILRKFNQVINFNFLDEVTKHFYCVHHGRPPIDLELYFRMVIIKYLYGISSNRKLCEEIRYNLAYQWFCGLSMDDKIPHHTSMSKIKKRLGVDAHKMLFEHTLKLCNLSNVEKSNSIIVDSTLVDADASLDSLVAIDHSQKQEEIMQHIDRSIVDPMPSRKISNKTHISKTDADASLARKNGSPQKLKYKVHNFLDSHKRIVLDTYVTTGKTHDGQVCLERILKLIQEDKASPDEVIADRGYGSARIIGGLRQRNIRTYIPLFSTRSGSGVANNHDFFSYNKEIDLFECRLGVYLRPIGEPHADLQAYYNKASDCEACPSFNECPARKVGRGTRRLIRRNINQDLFETVLEEMKHEVFKKKISERKWKIEGIFGEAKQQHGLRRAHYRGLHNMQVQAYLTASVQNLKRIVSTR